MGVHALSVTSVMSNSQDPTDYSPPGSSVEDTYVKSFYIQIVILYFLQFGIIILKITSLKVKSWNQSGYCEGASGR